MALRILTAEISHETNTFNIHPTDIQNFRDRVLLDGSAAMAARSDACRNSAIIHASVGNHFNPERHLYSRENFETNRAAALSEWRALCAA